MTGEAGRLPHRTNSEPKSDPHGPAVSARLCDPKTAEAEPRRVELPRAQPRPIATPPQRSRAWPVAHRVVLEGNRRGPLESGYGGIARARSPGRLVRRRPALQVLRVRPCWRPPPLRRSTDLPPPARPRYRSARYRFGRAGRRCAPAGYL